MREIYLIAAMTKRGVIGKNNIIPWHIPDDLKLFRQITLGGTVIMGRKTYESIGKPLPDRTNIIISKTITHAEGCMVFHSAEDALLFSEKTDKKVFFIGGAEVYKLAADIVTGMYISWIKEDYEGDTFFPEIDFSLFNMINTADYGDFIFREYRRISL